MNQSKKSDRGQLGIGEKINKLRESRNMPLSSLAAKAQISSRVMSQIETGQIPPGLVTLANISKALNVGMDFFFTKKAPMDTMELTRVNDRITVKKKSHSDHGDAHYDYQALSYRLKDKKMETFLAQFNESPGIAPLPVAHSGEEFCFCLKGEIDFITHDKTIRLMPGDSLHFYSQTPHVFKKASPATATALFILLPGT
ncbi:transcriptional regulator, XRE family with cupin sensor [Desulfocicer vacuolatum DSM 3385]|uniref:Transcriptional regulator, XRE family with cupin sensor n=1 Tax=Desulfocicer vacuolatum DSM 3385 TaxID=1121400 RepID=A0A1W2A3B5_9BACT|nr:XRE family transcriptional regulator [Desulfocicer vacuolatum]SMC54932.1 transcriptional regulator, XRE family with cupin sensor [Desulfocicer vacuolatum DSM 3385]